jgi:hypothetical protein
MRAIRTEQYGGPEVLRLVARSVAAVGPSRWGTARGRLSSFPGDRHPDGQ